MASKNFRNFEFKLGKLGLLLFVAGMSVLLFAVFVLGVFIGKDLDTMPGKIASDLPGTIKEKAGFAKGKTENQAGEKSVDREGIKDAAADRPPDFNWTFYDTLGRKKGEEKGIIPEKDKDRAVSRHAAGQVRVAQLSKPAEEQKPVPAGTSAAPEKKAAKTAGAEKKEKRAQSPAAKQPPVKNEPKVISTTAKALQEKGLVVSDVGGRPGKRTAVSKTAPPPATEKQEKKNEKKSDTAGTFFVQVCSYKEKEKSELAAKKVKFLGYKTKIVAIDLGSKGKWFRVVVDGFDTKEKAQKAAVKIKNQVTGTQCIVRSNSPVQKAGR